MSNSSTFFGRTNQLANLTNRLDRALSGTGQIVFIEGNAGAGKSALIETFVSQAQSTNADLLCTMITCDSQTGQSDAYLPFLETLAQLTGDADRFQSRVVSQENRDRIASFVSIATKTIVEEAPDLLGSLIPGGSFIFSAARFSAEKAGWIDKLEAAQKQARLEGNIDAERIYLLYTDLVLRLAQKVPLIIILDDLHWVDASSAQLLFHLSRRIEQAPILVIGAYRPNDLSIGRLDDRHPMLQVVNETKRVHGDILITLGDEDMKERQQFVNELIDSEPNALGEDFRQRFLAHTSGYPLFCQELLRTFQDSGALTKNEDNEWVLQDLIDWDTIPPRVEGVIKERIDRLDDGLRDVLSIASVQGEVFIVQVVAALEDLKERQLLKTVARDLGTKHGLVYESGSSRVGGNQMSEFRFSHNLFRQYLYSELSQSERMSLHGEIAEVIEELYGSQREELTTQLAYHYVESQEYAKAIPHMIANARRLHRLGAFGAALDVLHKALAHSEEENATESALEILVAIGGIQQALLGYMNQTVKATFTRACDIVQADHNPVLRATALYGLWTHALFALELEEAERLAHEIESIGTSADNSLVKVIAFRALANGYYQRGEHAQTIHYANLVLEHYQPELVPEYLLLLTYDPKAFSLGLRAWSESLTGQQNDALATEAQMFKWVEELGNPTTTCSALLISLELNYNLNNYAEIAQAAHRIQKTASEHNFPWYRAFGSLFEHWLSIMQNDPIDVPDKIGHLNVIYHEQVAPDGNLLVFSQFSSMLAKAWLHGGQPAQALEVVNEALSVAERHGEQSHTESLTNLKTQSQSKL